MATKSDKMELDPEATVKFINKKQMRSQYTDKNANISNNNNSNDNSNDNANNLNNNINYPPFCPHLTLEECNNLKINDKIDFR